MRRSQGLWWITQYFPRRTRSWMTRMTYTRQRNGCKNTSMISWIPYSEYRWVIIHYSLITHSFLAHFSFIALLIFSLIFFLIISHSFLAHFYLFIHYYYWFSLIPCFISFLLPPFPSSSYFSLGKVKLSLLFIVAFLSFPTPFLPSLLSPLIPSFLPSLDPKHEEKIHYYYYHSSSLLLVLPSFLP